MFGEKFAFLEPYFLSFIPLFVAIDIIGTLPFFIGITDGMDKARIKKVINSSVITAAGTGFGFMALGKVVFLIMGISVADFQIGGGILLLIFAIKLLLPGEKIEVTSEDVGVVPLGTPIITGPAVMTILLMSSETYGIIPTSVAFIINIIIVWIFFTFSRFIVKIIGINGSKAISKISYILLAAIAVMLIRKGITNCWKKN
jgi:multiple antibiotic resistance protein